MFQSRFIRTRPLTRKLIPIVSVVVCTVFSLAALRAPAQSVGSKTLNAPRGWMLTGSKPGNYQTGVDPQQEESGSPSAYLISQGTADEGFGTLMQMFNAGDYLGKRIRFTASVRTKEVTDWAGLWMRVDKGTASVGFDNMVDRPIKGTTGWQQYQVVLDVPQDASAIAFGVLLNKAGSVWLSNVKFETVGTEVATTGNSKSTLSSGPVNLNFKD